MVLARRDVYLNCYLYWTTTFHPDICTHLFDTKKGDVQYRFEKLMHERRSVRSFNGRAVSESDIKKLLEAAINAPNACNYQSWHFYVIVGKEHIENLVPSVYRGEWLRKAGVVFVVCTDAKRLSDRFGERGSNLFAIQDTACAIDHLMLMAAEMGLGSCFIGAFDENECRRQLDIPDKRRPVAIIPVGYAAEIQPKRDRKPLSEVCTFIGRPNEV